VDFDRFLPAFVGALRDFARFNGCDTVALEDNLPAKVRGPLAGLLEETGLKEKRKDAR
jgi:hypothetical protein